VQRLFSPELAVHPVVVSATQTPALDGYINAEHATHYDPIPSKDVEQLLM
jgi:hypothetical protein